MEIAKGDIIQSKNGRDKGRALFVIDVEETYLVLVDGKRRRIEQPKRKKVKHCMFLTRESGRVAEKLQAGERVANIDVRRALAAFAAGADHHEPEEE